MRNVGYNNFKGINPMKKKLLLILGLAIIFLNSFSCVSTSIPTPPHVETVYSENDHMKLGATLASYEWCSHNPNSGFSTKYQYAYNGINIYLENKTDKTIEIDWNKSAYLNRGETNGGFMYDGVKYSEREQINRRPDFVMPKKNFSKIIYPNKLVDYVPPYNGQGGGWTNKCIPLGSMHGVLLVYKIDGKEYYIEVNI